MSGNPVWISHIGPSPMLGAVVHVATERSRRAVRVIAVKPGAVLVCAPID